MRQVRSLRSDISNIRFLPQQSLSRRLLKAFHVNLPLSNLSLFPVTLRAQIRSRDHFRTRPLTALLCLTRSARLVHHRCLLVALLAYTSCRLFSIGTRSRSFEAPHARYIREYKRNDFRWSVPQKARATDVRISRETSVQNRRKAHDVHAPRKSYRSSPPAPCDSTSYKSPPQPFLLFCR